MPDTEYIKITNKDIYDKICKIEDTINGNGKTGLKQLIATNATNIKTQWWFIGVLVIGIVADLLSNVFL